MTLNSTNSGNHTPIVFFDELENITSSVWIKIFYCLVFCVSQSVSFLCYSGFIYFEHYGEDPMKRSIKVHLKQKLLLIHFNIGFVHVLVTSRK